MEGHKASFCLEDNDCQGKRPPIINHFVNAAINHDVSNTKLVAYQQLLTKLSIRLEIELNVITAIIGPTITLN